MTTWLKFGRYFKFTKNLYPKNVHYMSEVGGSLLRCGMLSGKICEDQR